MTPKWVAQTAPDTRHHDILKAAESVEEAQLALRADGSSNPTPQCAHPPWSLHRSYKRTANQPNHTTRHDAPLCREDIRDVGAAAALRAYVEPNGRANPMVGGLGVGGRRRGARSGGSGL
eukprot:CAMPEP_0181222500 /NCGR_PEP_ID=MMETSP1096-20121128/30000_1 /TAXON_ID=156174 ORGANISM="Chrysochromulina ericina, Strain CCMP281" /NCGR_SAMPLE_ID=MMETSP1096 /ASSEMBLY_ACC=CAM_ASM_000453 /LENGTH=119 /DNA_ID=CAMNT_0023315267 /DNA_START=454 /DNA_END=812 /DNA_ORIENTATION=-